MAKLEHLDVRYLVVKPGRRGALPRYIWQPSAVLRERGWADRRVPDNWQDFAAGGDGEALEAAAVTAAGDLNRQLDAWRQQHAAPTRAARRDAAAITAVPTVGDLVRDYRASDDFLLNRKGKARPASTKRGYNQCLDRIVAWAGDAPVSVISPKRIKALKKSLKATPSFCNAVVRVLRLLLAYAVREEWIKINPASKPGLVGTDSSGLLWPHPAVELFVAAADDLGRPSIGTAVTVDEWIGQREGDVLRLPRNLLQRAGADTVTLRQGKGGVAVSLPLGMVPHLVRRVEAEQARLDKLYQDAKVQPATLIVAEATGQPYKEDYFRHEFARCRRHMADRMREAAGWVKLPNGAWWSDEVAARVANLPPAERTARMAEAARRAASFEVDYLMPGREATDADAFLLYAEDLQFMHLRHTAVTRLAEADCSDELISVITGHAPKSVQEILKRYLVRTKKMARLAFQKRMDAEGIVGVNPLALPAPSRESEA